MAKAKLAIVLAAALALPAVAADLSGHGGPVRGMALAGDGDSLITGSFDSTVIRWSLQRSAALEIRRFHEGTVNAVVALAGGRFASAGEDARIAVWSFGQAQPSRVLEGHNGPVAALAASSDGTRLASASWDGTARIWSIEDGTATVLGGHGGNVNGVAFLPDGRIATVAYDGALRLFHDGVQQQIARVGLPLSVIQVASDGEIIVGGADGMLRMFEGTREVGSISVSQTPVASLALSRDGSRIAAAGFRGALALVDRKARRIERLLEGPAFPVWSVGFSADGTELLTGGANRIVRRWSVATGEPMSPVEPSQNDSIPAALRDHPGAAVFGACAACHTLTQNGGNRAGPSLAGLFGRKIASLPGYDFSPALKRLDIIWTEETVQRLFEIGPAAYTPGTKMPEQKVNSAADRKALVEFLKAAQTKD